jgi:hypothetical protein
MGITFGGSSGFNLRPIKHKKFKKVSGIGSPKQKSPVRQLDIIYETEQQEKQEREKSKHKNFSIEK